MRRSQKYMARMRFKTRIYESDGQKFEDLFVTVMRKSNPNFQAIKAHGRIGDMKNDGFDRTTGTYFQVYGPEDAQKDTTIKEAVQKVRRDFQGLKEKWNDVCPIQEFFYVVNDKYRGIPAPIVQELMQLELDNPETKCNLFSSKNLEDKLLELGEDDIIDVLDFIPDEDVGMLDLPVLEEVIIYIKESTTAIDSIANLVVPDFEEKIMFNGLSERVKTCLTYASYQIGELEDYFKFNSKFVRNELKASFKEIYDDAKEVIPDTNSNYSDERFFYIWNKASQRERARESKAYRDAVLVLMSYYFESCDIFEEPLKVAEPL